ncbi:MAG: glycosyltransferase family 4 protein, partial [Akkermansiaceae bacterium]|nr:glycosyltransferase family 4 protein [Akkermansiaceae bacterium]
PSVWWEPLGLVTYESYDAAKPMLAAASGGLTETVKDGETGLLHQPGDAASLADSVRKMEGRDEEQRREMGRRGRNWLLSEASPARWKRRFSEILENCLS